jgi:hypothetical protein
VNVGSGVALAAGGFAMASMAWKRGIVNMNERVHLD